MAVTFDVAGIDEAIRDLRLMPREVRQALRRAENKTGQRVRTVIRRELRSRLAVTTANARRRLRGQRGRAWVGANPVPAEWIEGYVSEAPDGTITVGGVVDPRAFALAVPGRPVVRRGDDGRLQRLTIDVLQDAAGAIDAAAAAAPDIYLEEFEKAGPGAGEPLGMATEVSVLVQRVAAALRADYDSFRVAEFDAELRYEGDEHLYVQVNAVGSDAGEPTGSGLVTLNVAVRASVNWRFVSASTLTLADPADVAASLFAWGHNRQIEGTLGPLVPRSWQYVEQGFDALGQGDTTRARYHVIWDVEIAVTPAVQVHTPTPAVPPDLGNSGTLTPPLRRLTAVDADGDERRLL